MLTEWLQLDFLLVLTKRLQQRACDEDIQGVFTISPDSELLFAR
jgi:hypothetical protein